MRKFLILITIILVTISGIAWSETPSDPGSREKLKEAWGLLEKGNKNFQAKNYDEAIKYYKEALVLAPRSGNAHHNLGLVYKEKGMTDEAIKEFEKALEINPTLTASYYNLGILHHLKGKDDEAIAAFKKALSINPDDANIHFNLGVAYGSKNMTDEAMAEYQKAIALKPDDADSYYNLGCIYSSKGLKSEASNNLHKAGLLYLEQGSSNAVVKVLEGLKALNARELEKDLSERMPKELK